MADKFYTREEVLTHNREDDCWIIIADKVFDVTKFLPLHPAGKKVILQFAGQDATDSFKQFHNFNAILFKYK